jgi:predicted permease
MSWLSQLWIEVRVRLFALVGRRHLRDRIEEEMRLHLELRAERLADSGLPGDEARFRARRGFGNPSVTREATLDMWRYGSMYVCLQDVRYGARLLWRNPIFALTAALSLAIGIGANTTVFSVANRLLLREPAGVTEPDRLVDIAPTSESGRFIEPFLSYRLFQEIRERVTTLESVYGYHVELQPMSLAGPGGAERIFGTFVTGNYFTTLGVRPAAGRLFSAVDSEQPGASPIAVLSHGFWMRRFNSDPSVVGQTLQLTGRPFTVVGVASEGFGGTSVAVADLWLPVSMRSVTIDQGPSSLLVGGRLKPGVSVRQAAAEVDAIGRALRRESPAHNPVQGVFERPFGGLRAVAASAVPPLLRLPVGGFLAFLMGIVSLVLLIACANVASVLLARATARRREIAVRLAIGAGRARLIRQLLTETLLLFVLGGVLGVALASAMTSLLVTVLPSFPVPIDLSFPLDRRVLLFSAGMSLVAALLSGLVPALQASRADVVSALKNDSQGPSDRLRLRSAFVVAQVAFSMLLVTGAGLLARALHRTGSVDLGFDPGGVEVASMDLSLAGYTSATGPAFVRELGDRLRRLPTVRHATMATTLPMEPDRRQVLVRRGPGAPPAPDPQAIADMPNSNAVAPGYFSTLRIPLVAGRDFTDADRTGTQPVAIVSTAAARQYWPGQNAVGQYLRGQLFSNVDLLVIGVASDLKTGASGEPRRPMVYLPLQQRYQSRFVILARSTEGQRLAGEIRALLASMDRNLPVVDARTLEDQSSPLLLQLRVSASVSGSVGLVGLLLAAIGVYGVTAYAVTRRTREIGIRIAMGAQRADVLRMVMRQGMWLVGVGSAIGLLLAAAGSRLLVRLLFGVPPLDPVTFAGAAALFAVIGLIACYVPARRATRIDTMEALRVE